MKDKNNKKNKSKKIVSQVLLGTMVMGVGVEALNLTDNSVFNINANALENSDKNIKLITPSQVKVGIKQVLSHSQGTILVRKDGHVYITGSNSDFKYYTDKFDTLTLITSISDVQKVGLSSLNTLMLKNDGTVWLVGIFENTGSASCKSTSTPMKLNVEGIVDIQGNYLLKSDGTVWEVGPTGSYGKAINPKLLTDNVKSISSSEESLILIKNDGTVWGYGANSYGQLGVGSTSDKGSPIQINIDNVKEVETSIYSTFFIKNDGTVWACGQNTSGQLGLGHSFNRSSPEQVNIDNVDNVESSLKSTFFIKNDGTVFATGLNDCGQLGINNKTNQISPVEVPIDDIKEVSAGTHTLFIKNDGAVYGVGSNAYGQLGIGNKLNQDKIIEVTPKWQYGSNYILDKIYNTLSDYKKYGSLATTTYGKSKYDSNKVVGYSNETTSKLSTINLDDSQYRINKTLANGSSVLVDNYGSVQYFSDLSQNPVNISIDGTTVSNVELGMLNQTSIIMLYKTDGTIWYFNPVESGTPLRMLPIAQNEMIKTSMYQEKNAVAKYFLFEKLNGDLVYYDTNRLEQSININMNNVKQVIPSTSNNSTIYVMKDGTLKDATKTIALPEGLTISEVISNRFLKLSDGFVYSINNNIVSSTGILYNAVNQVVNNIVWMKNGTFQSLTSTGTMKSETAIIGSLVQNIVAFDDNNTYIFNKDSSTYGIGNLIATTDLLNFGIDYNDVSTFISNNSISADNKLLIMKDGTVYTNPSNWTKSAQIYLSSTLVEEIGSDIEFDIDDATIATKFVENAENSKLQSDLNNAQAKVSSLEESETKTALQSRIDTLQALINKIKEATDLVIKAEGSKLQVDVTNALDKVNELPSGTEKTSLANRLILVQKEIDNIAKLQEATEAVVKAEGSKLQLDVNSARVLVNELLDNSYKTDLIDRLDVVQLEIDNVAKLQEATEAVVKAEGSKLQVDVNSARLLVNELLNNSDKTNLISRLNAIQLEIDNVAKLQKATEAVVKAENSKLQVDLNSARLLVNELSLSDEKTDLSNRLDSLQLEIDKIATATSLVVEAENSKSQLDLDNAQLKVNELVESTQKTDLLGRLNTLQDLINKIKDATDLVIKAEGSKLQGDVTNALEKVNALPSCTEKTDLLSRLNVIQQEINESNSEGAKIQEATALVVKAEGSKLQIDVDNAKLKVNALPSCTEKTNLLNRLQVVQDEINLNKLIKEATSKVQKSELSISFADIEVAQSAIDLLPSGEVKSSLQSRLDIVKERANQQEALERYNKLLQEATEKVTKAESTKLDTDIIGAQSLVNKLNENDKAPLQLRLDNLKQQVEDEKAQALYNKQLADAILKIEKAESSLKDFDVTMAQTAINNLKEVDKPALQQRLDAVKEAIRLADEQAKYNKLLQEATDKVTKAEGTKTDYDITVAQTSIDKLNPQDKAPLQLKLDNLKEQIRLEQEQLKYAKLLEDATAKVSKAEESKNTYDITVAKDAINKLKDIDKTPLQDRITILEYNILLEIANNKVKEVESLRTDSAISIAQSAIDKLPNEAPIEETYGLKYIVSSFMRIIDNINPFSDTLLGKAELQAKLDNLKLSIEAEKYNKLVQEATDAVIKAESSKQSKDIQVAQTSIDKLRANDKTPLQLRLDNLKALIAQEEKDAQDLKVATTKVEQAEAMKTQKYIDDAKLAVNVLKESPEKTALLNRIKAIEDKLVLDQSKTLIAQAETYLRQAEALKREPYIGKAQTAIDKIPDCAEKTALQNRLNAIRK